MEITTKQVTIKQVIAADGCAVRRRNGFKSAFGKRITVLPNETAEDFEELPYDVAADEAAKEIEEMSAKANNG